MLMFINYSRSLIISYILVIDALSARVGGLYPAFPGMWQTITDPETMEPSAEFGRMLHNQHLNLENEKAMAPAWDKESYCLQSGSP